MSRLETITKKVILGSSALFASQILQSDTDVTHSGKSMNYLFDGEKYFQKEMGPKLILKINDKTNTFALLFHRSHRSHSSHRSHYSSYSGTEQQKPSKKQEDQQTLGSRLLYKGLKGKDVIELRKLFVAHGYKIEIANELFDDKLEVVVKDYQMKQSLKVDGEVGPLMIYYLKEIK